jgi:hypothetical protein
MGYFRRRISRHRCDLQVARALARQSDAGLSEWSAVPDRPRATALTHTYLRFAVGRVHDRTRQTLGFFQAAYQLRDAAGRASDAGRMLQPLFTWFGDNLRGPDVASRAIFWFKSDASECVSRDWEMVHILKSHDHMVWMTRTDLPGRVVYEDRYQVAAVPFGRRPWRRRPV